MAARAETRWTHSGVTALAATREHTVKQVSLAANVEIMSFRRGNNNTDSNIGEFYRQRMQFFFFLKKKSMQTL